MSDSKIRGVVDAFRDTTKKIENDIPEDHCFATVQERLRYMAQVAKSDVMRFSLNNGAKRIDQCEAELAHAQALLAAALELCDAARGYILTKAMRHDLNWREGYDIADRIEHLTVEHKVCEVFNPSVRYTDQ